MRNVDFLIKTFKSDPLFQWIFNENETEMALFFNFMVKKSAYLDEWLLIEERNGIPVGAAFVEMPRRIRPISLTNKLSFFIECLKLMVSISPQTFWRLNAYMAKTSSARSKQPHYYLVLIGVSPEYQRQGIGKSIIEKIHRKVALDPSVMGIGLDTENHDNLSYYQNIGYEVVVTKQLGKMNVYCMYRATP